MGTDLRPANVGIHNVASLQNKYKNDIKLVKVLSVLEMSC